MELATLKALFPGCVTLALTATAPPTAISKIKNILCMTNTKVITANPNRSNVFLKKIKRSGSNQGLKSYDGNLDPDCRKVILYA